MIAIVNVSSHSNPFGIHKYEVRINDRVIAVFKHKREEGLTKCLQLAAAAVEKQKWNDFHKLLMEMENAQKSQSQDSP